MHLFNSLKGLNTFKCKRKSVGICMRKILFKTSETAGWLYLICTCINVHPPKRDTHFYKKALQLGVNGTWEYKMNTAHCHSSQFISLLVKNNEHHLYLAFTLAFRKVNNLRLFWKISGYDALYYFVYWFSWITSLSGVQRDFGLLFYRLWSINQSETNVFGCWALS